MEREVNDTDMGELARAFEPEKNSPSTNRSKRERNGGLKRRWSFVVLIVGIIALIAGVVVFLVRQNAQPPISDADFLINTGEWVEETNATVIWDFTEIGRGKLTTDGHLNNYDFKWSLDNGKLTIETEWLYDLSDTFDYSIDQNTKELTIKNSDKNVEVKFKSQERPEPPQPAAQSTEDGETVQIQEAQPQE